MAPYHPEAGREEKTKWLQLWLAFALIGAVPWLGYLGYGLNNELKYAQSDPAFVPNSASIVSTYVISGALVLIAAAAAYYFTLAGSSRRFGFRTYFDALYVAIVVALTAGVTDQLGLAALGTAGYALEIVYHVFFMPIAAVSAALLLYLAVRVPSTSRLPPLRLGDAEAPRVAQCARMRRRLLGAYLFAPAGLLLGFSGPLLLHLGFPKRQGFDLLDLAMYSIPSWMVLAPAAWLALTLLLRRRYSSPNGQMCALGSQASWLAAPWVS